MSEVWFGPVGGFLAFQINMKVVTYEMTSCMQRILFCAVWTFHVMFIYLLLKVCLWTYESTRSIIIFVAVLFYFFQVYSRIKSKKVFFLNISLFWKFGIWTVPVKRQFSVRFRFWSKCYQLSSIIVTIS